MRSVGSVLVPAALYVAVALGLLAASGAVESDFAGFEDEPAHLVSSLLVHDYLLAGMPGDPISFAQDYYLHYPKVTIGHWPPALPALVGLWALAAGDSPAAILVLFALLSAGAASMIHLASRRDAGELPAALFGLAFLLVPAVQRFGHMVLTELPLALACGLAVVSFGRYLEEGRARHVLGFALLAVVGIMTKGSAIFLALVPPVAIAISGRWRLLLRPSLWVAAALVIALCAPWYARTIDISTSSWEGGSRPTLPYVLEAAPFYAVELLRVAGWGVGALAVVGFAGALLGPLRRSRWAAIAAWPPSLVLCHVLVPTGPQVRHLVVALPLWLMGAALGTRLLADRFPRAAVGRVHLATVVAVLLAASLVGVERKEHSGYGEAARVVVLDEEERSSPVLISSDSTGEGAFVAAVALAEERPRTIVLRASKVLASTDWMGMVYEGRFESPEEMQTFLAETRVRIVAMDLSTREERRMPHERTLEELVRARPEAWIPAGAFDVVRDGVRHAGALRLYRQVVDESVPERVLAFEDVVGRDLGQLAR